MSSGVSCPVEWLPFPVSSICLVLFQSTPVLTPCNLCSLRLQACSQISGLRYLGYVLVKEREPRGHFPGAPSPRRPGLYDQDNSTYAFVCGVKHKRSKHSFVTGRQSQAHARDLSGWRRQSEVSNNYLHLASGLLSEKWRHHTSAPASVPGLQPSVNSLI